MLTPFLWAVKCCTEPSQAKVLRAETCTKRQSTSLGLLAIHAFDGIVRLCNRHLISAWGLLTLTILSQAEGLDRNNQKTSAWVALNVDRAGFYFGWLTIWGLSPDWRCRKLMFFDYCQAHRWSRRAWGSGQRSVPRLCLVYPGICLTTEENHGKTSARVFERWSVDQRRPRFF